MNKLIVLVIALTIATGCAQVVVGKIDHYDNSIFMLKPYKILSASLVRIELDQVEAVFTMSVNPTPSATVYDRIMEKIREQYPNADAVLIASFQSMGLHTQEYFFGIMSSQYKYTIEVYPIRYLSN